MRKIIQIAGLSFLLNSMFVFSARAQNTALRNIGPNDIYRMSTISSPKISPEGNWVLYSVSSIDSAKDKFSSKLYMVSADGKETVTLTVLVVLVSINAVNMVDGLDGLAASIVLVGAGAFFAYSYFLSVANGYQRAALATLVSASLIGMCAGFLPHNWYRARVFMGACTAGCLR